MGRTVAAMAAVGLLALGATACADDGDDQVATDGPAVEAPDGGAPGADLGALVPAATPQFMAASAQATAEVSSYRVHMELRVQGDDAVLLSADGAFSGDGSQGAMTLDLSGSFDALGAAVAGGEELGGLGDELTSMLTEPWEVVVDGPDTYVRMPFLSGVLGADTTWVRVPTEDGGQELGVGGLGQATSATEVVRMLEGAGEVTEVGAEDVAGVRTTHYRVDVDPAALAESVGEPAAAELEGLVPGAVALDVWIGDDGLVRRTEVVVDGGGLGAGAGQVLMVVELSDFDEPLDITVPDPSTVTDAEDLAGPFGGGLLGGG